MARDGAEEPEEQARPPHWTHGLGISLIVAVTGGLAVWLNTHGQGSWALGVILGTLVVALYLVVAPSRRWPPNNRGEPAPKWLIPVAVPIVALILVSPSAMGSLLLPQSPVKPSPSPTVSPSGGTSPTPTSTVAAQPVYVEGLLLNPPASGQGQAFMSGKAYDHSVWYETVWSMSFDIPVAGKYRFLDAQIGLHDGYTTSTTFDIKGDNVTLIGMHGVSNQPESVHVPIAGVQTLTIDVALYYQNAQTARFVLGNARLLT